jgi:hypothetical protein
MKTKILTGSALLVLLATGTGVLTAVYGHNPETITRASSVAGILGLASVGLFFVGLAFPTTAGSRK